MIHYHGTPISGGVDACMALAGHHAIVSFAAPECAPLIAEITQSFTLDNGAFSAWTRGEALDIEGFREFVSVWGRHPACDWYLIPDVIDGTESDNDALLSEWNEGVPVWHLHESLGRLERLCNTYPRVALGSSGDFAVVGTRRWWDRMAEVMGVACDAEGIPITKLHGLRMLDPTVFSHLPLSSADSTNVARNVGIDSAWSGPYAPASRRTRALILMERIEQHASAARWCNTNGTQQNLALFG